MKINVGEKLKELWTAPQLKTFVIVFLSLAVAFTVWSLVT